MAGTATGNAIQSTVSGGGTVTSVTAADTSIVVAGTAAAPTLATGTLDVIAADHPPAASVGLNSHKITSLANGTASGDAAAFGQIPAVWGPADQGLISWNYDAPSGPASGTSALTPAGTMIVQAVKLNVAQNITNIVTLLVSNGNTLTSGQCFAALYQGAAGTLLGVTADQSVAWGAGATKVLTMAIVGGPVAAAAGTLYVGWWYNGTTGPAFYRSNATGVLMNVGLAAAASRWGTANTGLTTTAPGTLGTISASNLAAYWAALS